MFRIPQRASGDAKATAPRLLRQGSANLPLRLETVVSGDSEMHVRHSSLILILEIIL